MLGAHCWWERGGGEKSLPFPCHSTPSCIFSLLSDNHLIITKGAPKILRLFGRGVSIEPGETGWFEMLDEFDSDLLDQYLAKGGSPPEVHLRKNNYVDVFY